MYKPERQKKILALIQEMSSVSVMDLAKQFAISPITIRRDLLELREKGLLERTFGGAIASQEIFAEGSARYETYDYLERNAQQREEKLAIAECAAQFVSDADCILINAGTTAQALAHALRGHQDLYVFTNGLCVATTLGQAARSHVYVLPGLLDTRRQATIQSPDASYLKNLRVREALLGVHAISVDGIFTRDKEDSQMFKAFINAATQITILADHTKFDSFASFKVCGLEKITRIVTDKKAPRDILEKIRDQDVGSPRFQCNK